MQPTPNLSATQVHPPSTYTIALDVDGPVADLSTPWITEANERFGDNKTLDDIKDWGFHSYHKGGAGVYDLLTPELYEKVQPVMGALERVRQLRALGHRVIFVTSSTESTRGAKFTWLKRHGFFDLVGDPHGEGRTNRDYVEANDKSLVKADIWVDDAVHNLKHAGEWGILWRCHHNKGTDWKYRSAASWMQVMVHIGFLIKELDAFHQGMASIPYMVRGLHPVTVNPDFQEMAQAQSAGAMQAGGSKKGLEDEESFYSPEERAVAAEARVAYMVHASSERIEVAPELLKHVTELKCPNQAAGFRAIIEKMYRTHLDKNADYSPANVLGTGELGLATRLWDKCIRYLNLMGFDIRAELVAYTGPKQAKNESIEDTLQDMSVYAIIGLLMRAGKWGN